jgi:DNA-binding PadR family transcriptional regulator
MRFDKQVHTKGTQRLVTLTDRIEKDAKGSLIALLILGIIQMEKKTWGYQIKKKLKEITVDTFRIKDSSLYTILNNLQEKYNLIQSNKDGKLRYYTITKHGSEEIKRGYIYWQRLVKIGNEAFETLGWSKTTEFLEENE